MSGFPARLVFVRHGRTDWNAAGLTMGWTDVPLNRAGVAEALALRPAIARTGPTSVWVSPLRRCRQTARLCLPRPSGLPTRLGPDLRERCWSRWEGRPAAERDPGDAEPMDAFEARVARALAAIDDEGLPLVVAHSGVLRAILSLSGGGPWSGTVPHARPIEIVRGVPRRMP